MLRTKVLCKLLGLGLIAVGSFLVVIALFEVLLTFIVGRVLNDIAFMFGRLFR